MENTPYYTSLVEAHQDLLTKGYDKNYKVTEAMTMEDGEGHKYSPNQLSIDEFHRFEGDTDPADNSILYAVSANDGRRGTLVDAFGAQGSMKTAKFILEVEHKMQNALIKRYNWVKANMINGMKKEEKLLIGLAVGAVVGTVVGVLLAPRNRNITQHIYPQLKDFARSLGNRKSHLVDSLTDKIGL